MLTDGAPGLRARVWNLLRTARSVGRAGVAVATLAVVLRTTPEGVLTAVLSDMTETPAGHDAPSIHCAPTAEGPVLTPRLEP